MFVPPVFVETLWGGQTRGGLGPVIEELAERDHHSGSLIRHFFQEEFLGPRIFLHPAEAEERRLRGLVAEPVVLDHVTEELVPLLHGFITTEA